MSESPFPHAYSTEDENEPEEDVTVNGNYTHYESQRKRLKRQRSETPVDFDTIMNSITSKVSKPPRYVIHHEVYCNRQATDGHNHSTHPPKATYIDVPRLFAKDSRASPLCGKDPVHDINTFQHHNDDVCLIVCKRYDCEEYHDIHHTLFTKYPVPSWVKSMGPYDARPWFYFLREDAPEATTESEHILLCSDELKRALSSLRNSIPRSDLEGLLSDKLESPYEYFYHHHAHLRQLSAQLSSQDQQLVSVLLNYIVRSQKTNFEEADSMFRRGAVSQAHFGKLFKTSDIVVRNESGGPRAYKIESIRAADRDSITMDCWTWEFDGQFYKSKHEIFVEYPYGLDEVPLTSLAVWPLRLDNSHLSHELRERGMMFWTLRQKRLVHYDAPVSDTFELSTSNPKYMVDMSAYRTLHADKLPAPDPDRENLRFNVASEEPPEEPFVLLLPPSVKGFGFHDKKWRTLQVSSMKEVSWNTQAFKRLVLGSKKKELIEALVTVHLDNTALSDVVEGKGAGLILLLHGPPGTGKTLTAESVAELAKKPLYRITCGDMGTDPESVEKYLESALYIGTMWECVVLLDEADVFLEERTQTDLIRNALVSVFLRVLEYYEGILILTSNRVGSFDEAFKSRMQLAIQYPVLGFPERKRIWTNFIRTLKESKVEMNASELEEGIEDLARHEFNGRQIRNLIKTARQLATFRMKEVLQIKHFDHVIDVANEFESYIVKTKGVTDEQKAARMKMRA